jgi:glutathionyl-hydroquinone reductase
VSPFAPSIKIRRLKLAGNPGWRFVTSEDKDIPGENVIPDPLHAGFTHLREVYFESNEDYQGRFTVPVLYDKKTNTIVNNESSEIIRMLGTEVCRVQPTLRKPSVAQTAH